MPKSAETVSTPQKILARAFIIGGSPCSGKSTLAEQLSRRFNLQYYKVDDYQEDHIARCRPDCHPTMYSYLQMDWDTRWMRPVDEQVQELLQFFSERFEMLLEDLGGFDPERAMIIEGAALLPDLVAPYQVERCKTLFMIPTKAFQIRHYKQRAWIGSLLAQCADPEQAFANWMERDFVFGQEIVRQARAHQFPVVVVDGSMTPTKRFVQVSNLFDLAKSA